MTAAFRSRGRRWPTSRATGAWTLVIAVVARDAVPVPRGGRASAAGPPWRRAPTTTSRPARARRRAATKPSPPLLPGPHRMTIGPVPQRPVSSASALTAAATAVPACSISRSSDTPRAWARRSAPVIASAPMAGSAGPRPPSARRSRRRSQLEERRVVGRQGVAGPHRARRSTVAGRESTGRHGPPSVADRAGRVRPAAVGPGASRSGGVAIELEDAVAASAAAAARTRSGRGPDRRVERDPVAVRRPRAAGRGCGPRSQRFVEGPGAGWRGRPACAARPGGRGRGATATRSPLVRAATGTTGVPGTSSHSGRARPAERRADVHERRGSSARPVRGHRVVGDALQLDARTARSRPRDDPSEDAPDVDVDGPDRRGRTRAPRRRGPCTARRPAGPRSAAVDGTGRRARRRRSAPPARGRGPAGRSRGPATPAGRRPAWPSARASTVGNAVHEAFPVLCGARGLGLLGHRLGDEDRVRVARAAEGERPAALGVPGEDRVPRRAARRRSGSAHDPRISREKRRLMAG